MRWPRMTTRRWLMVVAAAAVILGALRLHERRAYFLARAEDQEWVVNWLLDGRMRLREELWATDYPQRLFAYRQSLAYKYRYAADHPWISIEPDPDEPEP